MTSNGEKATGWQSIGGKWYHLNNNGVMNTGWVQLGNQWYHLNNSGAMNTEWVELGGKWYYLNNGGAMATGWQYINGKWYHLNNNGVMNTGWTQLGSKWYHLNNSGAMNTGWIKLGDKWYYLDNSGAWDSSKVYEEGSGGSNNSGLKDPIGLPGGGATIIDKPSIYFHTYSYNRSLPGGGSISMVHAYSADGGGIRMKGIDNNGVSFTATYIVNQDAIQYSMSSPKLTSGDLSVLYEIGDAFSYSYGM